MPDDFSNDNVALGAAREPDAHGQAAILLVESLIHGLIERSLITVADAVEIVETVTEVRLDSGPGRGESQATLQKSITLLQAIRTSLQVDVPVK